MENIATALTDNMFCGNMVDQEQQGIPGNTQLQCLEIHANTQMSSTNIEVMFLIDQTKIIYFNKHSYKLSLFPVIHIQFMTNSATAAHEDDQNSLLHVHVIYLSQEQCSVFVC